MSTPNSSKSSKQPLIPQATLSDDNGTHQLANAIDDLLDQLQSKFDNVSKEIFGRMDDMARRLDTLEASMSEASAEAAPKT